MAIILKETKSFNPAVSISYGVDMTNSNYYGVIDEITYDKNDKNCNFSLSIFGTKALRVEGGSSVDRINLSFHGDKFDLKIGNNGLTIPQAYVLALDLLPDWKSDE